MSNGAQAKCFGSGVAGPPPRWLRWLPILIVLLAAGSGCLQVKQELIIHRNGSARILLHYSLPETAVPLLREAVRQRASHGKGQGEPPWWFNREACILALQGSGIDLERHQVYSAAGRRHAVLECRADNLNAALGKGPLKAFRLSETEDGKLRLVIDRPELPAGSSLERLPEDLRLELSVTTPSPVTETSGAKTEDRTAVWVLTPRRLSTEPLPEFFLEFEALGAVGSTTPGQEP